MAAFDIGITLAKTIADIVGKFMPVHFFSVCTLFDELSAYIFSLFF